MSTYRVQAGDSYYSIAHRFAGSPARARELLTMNRYRPLIAGHFVHIPPAWGLRRGVGQTIPSYSTVACDGTGPVWAVEGPAKASGFAPCCPGCEDGTGCAGTSNTLSAPCSKPKAPMSIPGSTSFPVGFGQNPSPPITTTSVPVAMAAGWGVPIAIAALAGAAGFGLAYLLAK